MKANDSTSEQNGIKQNGSEYPEDSLEAKISEDIEIYREFIAESSEHLQDTEANILSLEDNPGNPETLNSIFRSIHSIKGSAGFLGLQKIQKLSHELETVLDRARKYELEITSGITDVLLNSIDILRMLLDSIAVKVSRLSGQDSEKRGGSDSEDEIDIDIEPTLYTIKSILSSGKEEERSIEDRPAKEPDKEAVVSADINATSGEARTEVDKVGEILVEKGVVTREQIEDAISLKDKRIGEILVKIGATTREQIEKAASLKEKRIGEILVEMGVINQKQLEETIKTQIRIGEVLIETGIATEQQIKEDPAFRTRIGEILVERGVATKEQVEKAADIKNKKIGEILVEKGVTTKEQVEEALALKERKLGEILVEKGTVNKKQLDDALSVQAAQRRDVDKSTVKIDTSKLDNLFDLVGELVITSSLINEEFASQQGKNNLTSQNLSQLGKIVKDLQNHVMSLRMLPLKQTFQKMSRLVRDISASSGKPIKLNISGEDTELDKNVIEQITDPLVHILRNAVDHGIEPPEVRRSLNKPLEGDVYLKAFHRGGNIIIEIEDDGKGLSRERIIKKGTDKGLISDPSSLTDEQVFQLIFLPGFSTAENVTNISGRGVGMDVVKRNIENLHGKVEIATEEGKWSRFTIKLPLTLAIIDGIVITIGGSRYIIPIASVEESIRPEKDAISTIGKREEILNIRGEIIPLVRFHKLYDLNCHKNDPWEAIVVIVQAEGQKFGIMVDELVGQQQVVIKNLGRRFKTIKGVSGGAIMGNGEVGLILDISGIKELAFPSGVRG